MKNNLFILSLIFIVTACAHNSVAPLSLIGKWHTIKNGDTAQSVAKEYGIKTDILVELNDIPPDGKIKNRTEIFIPLVTGNPPGTGKKPAVTHTVATSGDSSTVQGYCGTEGRPCFAWPVKGTLFKNFGPDGKSHNDGIEISAKEGTPVTAAEKGVVIYSGDAIKGYGNLILLKHANSIISVYAHSSKIFVKEGQKVTRGEKIAEAGKTGAALKSGLHFEIRVKEQPIDPMGYLPTPTKE